MITDNSHLYMFDEGRAALVLPVGVQHYVANGSLSEIVCYDSESEALVRAAPTRVLLVSNEGEFVTVEIEGKIKLTLSPTSLVLTTFGYKLADMLAPPMEVLGLPRGTELRDPFLFVYPRPGLYRVTASMKPAPNGRVFVVASEAECCIVDGIAVKTQAVA